MSRIHQEISFDAAPARIYHALTNEADFAAFTGAPARIVAEEGAAFVCFGEFVLGRFVELVPDRRIVQAWRVFNWPEGVFSIVRFDLQAADRGGTRLVLDQDGVPDDMRAHVDPGWHHKYWEPLRKHVAGGA